VLLGLAAQQTSDQYVEAQQVLGKARRVDERLREEIATRYFPSQRSPLHEYRGTYPHVITTVHCVYPFELLAPHRWLLALHSLRAAAIGTALNLDRRDAALGAAQPPMDH
jgi:hypothetical protein